MKQIKTKQQNCSKRFVPSLAVLALGCALSAPARLNAQTPDVANSADAAFNGGPASGPTPIAEVPKGQQIPVESAQFDQGGYLIKEKTGQTVDVPFTDHNLEVMRFARSTTGETYLVNEEAGPVLYVPNHYFLVSTVAESALWQPLPDSYVDVHPIYVSIAPSWDEFVHLDFYADMHWYGGVWGYRRGYLEAMPHRAVTIRDRAFRYDEYRRYAGEHPGTHITRNEMHDRGLAERRERIATADRHAEGRRADGEREERAVGNSGHGSPGEPAARQFGYAGHHNPGDPARPGAVDPAPHSPTVGTGSGQPSHGTTPAPAKPVRSPAAPAPHPSTPKPDKKSSK